MRTPCAIPRCRSAVEPVEGVQVCGPHGVQLASELRAIPSLFDRLSPVRGAATHSETYQKPVFESQSPADDHALMLSDARSVGGPLYIMRQWQIAFWRLKIDLYVDGSAEIVDLAGSMALHWPHWQKTEFAGEFFDAMHEIWLVLSQSVGDIVLPAVIGVCGCGTRLFRDPDVETVECRACGRIFDDLAYRAVEKARNDYFYRSIPHWRHLVRSRRSVIRSTA